MAIDIRALNNGESVNFSETIALDIPRPYGVIGDNATVCVSGKALRHGDDFTVLALCETDYTLECARCLAPVASHLDFTLEERYHGGDTTGEVDAWPLTSRAIELTQAVESAFYSLIPSKILCDDNCIGIEQKE